MNPRLVRCNIAARDTIWTRRGEIVSQQSSVASGGYAKRHAGSEALNAAQLPTFDHTIALEWQPVHRVQREVMSNIETAIALVGRAIVRIVPRRSSVIPAQAAIGVSEVNAVRKSVRKICLKTIREPLVDANLHGVVYLKASGLIMRHSRLVGIGYRIAHGNSF